MRHLYEPRAYDTSQWPDSHWRQGVTPVAVAALEAEAKAEVVVIGAGYAGLSAALALAEAGVEVAVVDAGQPGWGSSGRNGGFCGMGGTKLGDAALVRRFGRDGARAYHDFQKAAVAHVAETLAARGIDAERGPSGEPCLAHSRRAFAALAAAAEAKQALYGEAPKLLPAAALAGAGLGMAGAHGASVRATGFPLHPMKYVLGLARAAQAAGVRIFGDSEVKELYRDQGLWRLETPRGTLSAQKVLIATNGYSSEDLPPWIEGRTLPVISSIRVTRPLSEAERAAQGWTGQQMAFDSRHLLHYFRLLPDNRFLFGMRGGLSADPGEEASVNATARRHLAAMFPAWAGVEIEREWSGFVCLTGSLTPYAGPVPETEGLYAAFGWHGNGVSIASYAGHQIGRMIAGAEVHLPAVIARPPSRFPVPFLRRQLMRLTYALIGLGERSPKPAQTP